MLKNTTKLLLIIWLIICLSHVHAATRMIINIINTRKRKWIYWGRLRARWDVKSRAPCQRFWGLWPGKVFKVGGFVYLEEKQSMGWRQRGRNVKHCIGNHCTKKRTKALKGTLYFVFKFWEGRESMTLIMYGLLALIWINKIRKKPFEFLNLLFGSL